VRAREAGMTVDSLIAGLTPAAPAAKAKR